MNPQGTLPGVPAVYPQPGTVTMTNDQLTKMISDLQTNITTEIETRMSAQNAQIEDRLKPVTEIQQTLEQARQNQIEAQRRQQQQNQPAWTPKSWDEIPQMIQTEAERIAKKTLDDRDAQARAIQDRENREEQELEAQIDRQIAALEQNGYIPRTVNPNDYNDPGVAAKRELLTYASYIGSPELSQVATQLAREHSRNQVWDSQTSSFKEHNGLTPLPGKNAPVGMGGVNALGQPMGPSYAQIHNARDLDSLVALSQQQGAGPLPSVPNFDAADSFFGGR